MKKLLLFFALVFFTGINSTFAATEYDLGTVSTSICGDNPLGLKSEIGINFGENFYYLGTKTIIDGGYKNFIGLYDKEKNLVSDEIETPFYDPGPYVCTAYYRQLARFSKNGKTVYLIETSQQFSSSWSTHLFYINSDLDIKYVGKGYLNFNSINTTGLNISDNYVKYGNGVLNMNTLTAYTGSLSLDPIYTRQILYYNSAGGTTQFIYYGWDEKYYLSTNVNLGSNNYGINNEEIFIGSVSPTAGELEQLDLDADDKTGVIKSVFRTLDIGADRFYWLSGCKTGSGYTYGTGYTNNITFIGVKNIGIAQGFADQDNKYWDFIYNGVWLKTLNNGQLINYGGECLNNYGFSDFVNGLPTRVYVVRNGRLYMNLLNQSEIGFITGEGAGGGGGGGGLPGGGTNIPGTIDYEDPFATCNEDPSITQFLGCIAEWISYIFGKLISFFEAITDFINKILDLFTEEERSLTSYIFGIEQANAGGDYNRLLPERPADYGDSFMGKFDGMVMGIVYFLLVIITLVVILIMVKK